VTVMRIRADQWISRASVPWTASSPALGAATALVRAVHAGTSQPLANVGLIVKKKRSCRRAPARGRPLIELKTRRPIRCPRRSPARPWPNARPPAPFSQTSRARAHAPAGPACPSRSSHRRPRTGQPAKKSARPPSKLSRAPSTLSRLCGLLPDFPDALGKRNGLTSPWTDVTFRRGLTDDGTDLGQRRRPDPRPRRETASKVRIQAHAD